MNLPKINNPKLFKQAFTHRSYLNEVKPASRQGGEKIPSNERLEFLGDSIISLIVSNFLFNKYPDYDEGKLTNLRSLIVNTKSLAIAAKELNFGELLLLSKGEEESKGRQNQSLLADSFEAFVGALFLDQGLEIVSEFIKNVLLNKLESLIEGSLKDPKSLLQELVQSKMRNSPLYRVMKEVGPSHAKLFSVAVFVKEKIYGEGIGKSKQEAEENAAKEALEKIGQ